MVKPKECEKCIHDGWDKCIFKLEARPCYWVFEPPKNTWWFAEEESTPMTLEIMQETYEETKDGKLRIRRKPSPDR